MKLFKRLACLVMLVYGDMVMAEACYFDEPEKAVGEISRMLHEQDWLQLACYYDLSDSGIERAELESGDFFKNSEHERVGPPGLSTIKEPFSPSFVYRSHHEVKQGLWQVELEINIDQGDGMVMHGLSEFYLRQSVQGFQIVPKAVITRE